MRNLSSGMEQFARTCARLLSEVPTQISEQERSLIEHFCLELFSKYGTHNERRTAIQVASIIPDG